MTVVFRLPPRRVQLVLGLALIGLMAAPSASNATSLLDTVTATGSSGHGTFAVIQISAQSSVTGTDVSGTGSFTVGRVNVKGPVTCLRVSGPDRGGGTVGSPTTAILTVDSSGAGVVTVKLIDNGGNGPDFMGAFPLSRSRLDCSTPMPGPNQNVTDTLTNGRAIVFDAPPLPTSKAQCRLGGWQTVGSMFKNQGQCVAFVVQQARQHCVAERARIGLRAFRQKYGGGPSRLRAMRRCVRLASR